MSIRTVSLAASVLVLALVVTAGAAGKPRPSAPSDKQPPTTPTNLRITGGTDTSISLAWDASTDNSTSWWYCVQVDGASCLRVDPPQTAFTRSNLTPGRTTTWTVYAIDAAGNRSGTSNAVTYTTPADSTPPTAPVLSAGTVTSTWFSVSWTASSDSASVLYTVYLDGAVYLSNLSWRFANLFHLAPSSTHEVRVDAKDSYGNVSQSNVVSVTTPAPTNSIPPTAPANLSLGFQSGSGEAWLSWERSTDDADPQHLILYDIYFNGVRNDLESIIGGDSTITYCIEQGTSMTEIVLRAVDTSGNVSAPSNRVSVDC